MKCAKCENIERDPKTGYLICLKCGNVIEDSTIVQGIEFTDDQKAIGSFIDNTRENYFPLGKYLGHSMDPTEVRLNKVFKYMVQIAAILTIPTTVIDKAKRIYKSATVKNFTQGRRTKQIVGAILYLACRWECTKHLLIDFSEVLQINLFAIGSTYLKLVILLDLKKEIKIIDPSLFMHRYCNKFKNFGKESKNVEKTALKILQFLKRDWITTGRRPSGLCGACILISAKLHGFDITIDDISNAVNVCNETIKKRIEEFSLTKVASMTKEQFEEFEESHYYYGMDPPAFLKNRDKEKEIEDVKVKEENQNVENGGNKNKPSLKEESDSEDVFLHPMNIKKEKSNLSQTELLSRLEEKDEAKYIYNENEYTVRKKIWEIMYKSWLEEQEEKRLFGKGTSNINNNKKPRTRKTSVAISQSGLSQGPYEAIKNSNKFGKKMNYSHIKNLFNKKK